MSQTVRTFNLVRSAYLPHQWEYITSVSNRLCLGAGYGAGKTFSFIRKCIVCHLTKIDPISGKSKGWVIYPTYDLAEDVFVNEMLDKLEALGIDCEYNISKHKFTTAYGTFRIFSGNNPERMVGSNLTWCGADELDILATKKAMMVYNKAISRLRGCENAPFFTVTTLEGYRAVYDLFYANPTPEKHLIKASSHDNPFLPDGYIQSLINDYDSLMQDMYILGNPVNLNGSAAYYKFTRNEHVKPCLEKDTFDEIDGRRIYHHPLWLGVDFNIEPMTASASILLNENGKTISYTVREWHLRVGNTRMLMELVRQEYPDRLIIACPDMSGYSRVHTFSNTAAERTDVNIIKGFDCEVRGTHNMPQRDRLNIVNNLYEKGLAYIDPSCKNLIKDRERVIITDNQIDKTDGALTHCSDGNDYMLIQQYKPERTFIAR